jgi:hypothetical protein
MRQIRRTAWVAIAAVVVGIAATGVGAEAGSSRVGITCNDKPSKPAVRVRPTKCTILPGQASFAEGSNLAGLVWRSWGGAVATGTGFELGFHLPLSHIPAALVAYRLMSCSDGTRVYSRVRVTSSYGTGNVRAQGCVP